MSEHARCECDRPEPDGQGHCEKCWNPIGTRARYRLNRLAEARERVERTMRKIRNG